MSIFIIQIPICSILGVIAGPDGRSLLSATKKESASDHTNLKDYDRDLETKWQQEVTIWEFSNPYSNQGGGDRIMPTSLLLEPPRFESVTTALCLDHQTCNRQLTSVVNPGFNYLSKTGLTP